MKEEKLKELLSKNTLKTSPGFTDRLILKIAAEKEKTVPTHPVWQFRFVLSALLLIMGTITFLLSNSFEAIFRLLRLETVVSNAPFMMVLFALLLMGINYSVRLHELSKRSKV